MIKVVTGDKLRSDKILLFLAITVCFAFFAVSAAFAEEASGSAKNAKKYNITFPVAELGNCASLEDCKAYCSEVTNQQACSDFAKKKGLPRKEEKGLNRGLLEKAKAYLGCASEQTCKAFCQDSANFEKCSLFAKENKLRGGMKNASGSGQLKRGMMGGPEGTKGGMLGPQSDKAYENANANARFCRENSEKCRNASGSANLEQRREKEEKLREEKKKIEERYKEKMEKEREIKKKGQEIRDENANKIEDENDEVESEEKDETVEPQVQGVSTSPSVFEQIFRFFFR